MHPGRRQASWRERLQRNVLWWRHSYAFRWAHRPLCDRFAHGVLKIGPVRLCRSCTLLYVAAALTLAVVVTMGSTLSSTWLPTMTLVLLPPVVVLSQPMLYDRLGRRGKDALRFATGSLLPLLALLWWHGHVVVGLASTGLFVIAYWVALRAYRVRKARACAGCPELGAPGICSGFQVQAASARRYALTVEQQWLAQPPDSG